MFGFGKGSRNWWKYLINFQVISFIIIIIVAGYFILTDKRKKYNYVGLGDSGWDLSRWKQLVGGTPFQKRRARPKRPRFNKHEERCREIFENIFRAKFKSIRPNLLKNPVTGKNLELDGFCPHIKTPLGKGLAFEYDGAQHSKYNKHFHRAGPNEFLYQVKKDEWKDIRCKEENILLIRIPHFVAYEDLQRFITNKLRKKGVGFKTPSGNSWRTVASGAGFLSGLYG